MTETFKVGDEVIITLRGSRATVEYGPFDDRDVYVVKLVDQPMDPDDVRTFTALASVMKPASKFAVGDKVTHPDQGSGEVVFGPFVGAYDPEVFLVAFGDGRTWMITPDRLTPNAPEPIKVGDRVRVTDDNRDGTKFGGRIGVVQRLNGGSLPYYVRFGDGRGFHGADNGYWNCRAVERVEDGYEYDGVSYDLTAKYRDREGDIWRFEAVDGTVRGTCDEDGDARVRSYHATLERIVDDWAPLTRV